MNDYIIMSLFWWLGGIVNGIAGFGCALVATPLCAMFVDITLVVPAGTLIGLSMNSQTGITFRKYADWNRIRYLFAGALPGTVVGLTLMKSLPPDYLKLGMGLFLILYVTWAFLFEGKSSRVISKYWGVFFGTCSCAIGTSVGMGGPPTIVYTSLTGWNQKQIKAGIGSFFMFAGLIMFTGQALTGFQTKATLTLAIVAIPSAVFGGWIGMRIARLIGDFSYRKILFSMLACMGTTILYQSVSVLL
jgi:uncharacterized membrane protein YfcA